MPPNIPTLELSLGAVRALLFGDEALEGVRPVSPALGDTAKVIVIPRAIAEVIASCDPEEFYFHIILLPKHGEVWLSFEWKDSNARRKGVQTASRISIASDLKARRRMNEISRKLVAFGIPDSDSSYLSTLSSKILENHKSGKAHEILKLLNLAQLLASYEDEDRTEAAETTKVSQSQEDPRPTLP